jgi:DnaJ-class molecular chaperone
MVDLIYLMVIKKIILLLIIIKGNNGRPVRKGEDIVQEISVSLEELYNGKTISIDIFKNIICKKCEG